MGYWINFGLSDEEQVIRRDYVIQLLRCIVDYNGKMEVHEAITKMVGLRTNEIVSFFVSDEVQLPSLNSLSHPAGPIGITVSLDWLKHFVSTHSVEE